MSKKSKRIKESTDGIRAMLYRKYRNQFYTLFMSAYRSPQLSKRENNFLFREFWFKGRIACFKEKNAKIPMFTPFVPFMFDSYDFPVKVRFIPRRPSPFIPINRDFEVDKDVVLGYASKACMPKPLSVSEIVDWYVIQIVDVDMTIRTNLKVHKKPWLVGVTPENKDKMEQIYDDIEDDEAKIFIETNAPLDSVSNSAPYIIDKLYAYKKSLENELLTYLGINSLGVNEKKERMITDEVNVNNQLVCAYADSFIDCLEDFSKELKEVLGFEITFEVRHHIENFTAEDSKDDTTEGGNEE